MSRREYQGFGCDFCGHQNYRELGVFGGTKSKEERPKHRCTQCGTVLCERCLDSVEVKSGNWLRRAIGNLGVGSSIIFWLVGIAAVGGDGFIVFTFFMAIPFALSAYVLDSGRPKSTSCCTKCGSERVKELQ